jgi:hypothetical protein
LSSATRSRARQPELEEALDRKIRMLLAAGSDPRTLSLGRAIDRARRHPWEDHHHVADRLAADARRCRPQRARRRHRAQFGEHGSSYRIGQGRDFVIEGDEYDSALLRQDREVPQYLPDIAVINNVEFDHADIYPDFDAVTLGVPRLVNLVPRKGCC